MSRTPYQIDRELCPVFCGMNDVYNELRTRMNRKNAHKDPENLRRATFLATRYKVLEQRGERLKAERRAAIERSCANEQQSAHTRRSHKDGR